MRTGNPVLRADTFTRERALDSNVMTVQGAALKTGLAVAIVIAAASFTWWQFSHGGEAIAMAFTGIGALVGFVVALITSFNPTAAPFTTPLYAIAEGFVLGGISAIYEARYPGTGIVLNAVALTLGTLVALLAAYVTGVISATENLKLGIFAATGGICMVYLASWILSFFGIHIPYIHGSGPIGIGFSLFVVVVAALNLVLDFDFIEKGAEHGAPKHMEWYAAFGLLVTLVWLYLEILRLLAKLQDRGGGSRSSS
jgi:uncharacterized YccA/Bax inhibitor family protein